MGQSQQGISGTEPLIRVGAGGAPHGQGRGPVGLREAMGRASYARRHKSLCWLATGSAHRRR